MLNVTYYFIKFEHKSLTLTKEGEQTPIVHYYFLAGVLFIN